MDKNLTYLAIGGFIFMFLIGMGAGFALNSNNQAQSQPYELTLVITDNNMFNSSVGPQPAYFVLINGQLQSSAVINVPAHRLIDLTIVNYDDGADQVGQTYTAVNGTQNNQMLVVSNDLMNASEQGSNINLNLNDTQTVSSWPADDISHTFTINELNFNIPVAPSSTVHAFATFDTTGSYTWQCFVICGSGTSGWGGAMSTAGWMTGSFVIS